MHYITTIKQFTFISTIDLEFTWLLVAASKENMGQHNQKAITM